MIIRIRWPLILRQGMLLQLLHHDLDCLIELRVVSLAIGSRVEIDFDVWSYSVILHFPLAFETIDSAPRRRHMTSVEQLRVTSNPDQTAPGFLADQWPQP